MENIKDAFHKLKNTADSILFACEVQGHFGGSEGMVGKEIDRLRQYWEADKLLVDAAFHTNSSTTTLSPVPNPIDVLPSSLPSPDTTEVKMEVV